MTVDLILAFRQVVGQEAFDAAQALPRSPWCDIDPPDIDLHVSESDARWMQRAYDSRLTQMWGPQV